MWPHLMDLAHMVIEHSLLLLLLARVSLPRPIDPSLFLSDSLSSFLPLFYLFSPLLRSSSLLSSQAVLASRQVQGR